MKLKNIYIHGLLKIWYITKKSLVSSHAKTVLLPRNFDSILRSKQCERCLSNNTWENRNIQWRNIIYASGNRGQRDITFSQNPCLCLASAFRRIVAFLSFHICHIVVVYKAVISKYLQSLCIRYSLYEVPRSLRVHLHKHIFLQKYHCLRYFNHCGQ